MPSKTGHGACADCQAAEGSLDVRKRPLCPPCFIRYVNSKILKRMESYRLKNSSGDQKRRLLLPLSGGISSLVLLNALDAQLQKQLTNRKKTVYDLVIAHVVVSPEPTDAQIRNWYDKVATRFSTHVFLPPCAFHDAFRLDESLTNDLQHLGLARHEAEAHADFSDRVLLSARSPTTRADLQRIILRRLLAAMAKRSQCESILWGHSDSQMAAQTLADVAKGRGGSVPFTISDGPSPSGLNFNHPVRDLFKSELELYADVLPEPLSPLALEDGSPQQVPRVIRNMSIDDLLRHYIDTQAAKYPSVMANVVRTASKLENSSTPAQSPHCAICLIPQPRHLSGAGSPVSSLCYGCARMKEDIQGE